ncbi:MAG: lipopolysaccharide biosynthesis protein [Actinobacteria bacterium]|nr:lipopolysaccharide biosynthesis protein [Actinomycetota bacterium]
MTDGDATAELAKEPRRLTTARRSIAYLAGGSLVSTALYALGGLVVGRLVAPATLGLFNGIGLALSYAALLQLGVFSGLSRELPYFIGKGERPTAEKLCAVAQAWAFLVGGSIFLVLLGVGGWELAHGDLWRAAGWFTNAIMAIELLLATYLQVIYRTAHDFARVAFIRVIQQGSLLVLLVLVIPLNFYGLCLRVLLAGALNVVLLAHWRPVRVTTKWSTLDLKHLLRIGTPIFAVGQILTYWAVVDQTLVLRLGGTTLMGLYSMAIMVRGAVATLPTAVSQVFFPRMSQKFGEGQSLRELLSGITKPMAVSVAALTPAVLILWWLVGPITRFLLPHYVDAVSAMQWVLPACLLDSFEPGIAILTVARRQLLRLVGIAVGIAAYTVSLVWLIRNGVHLVAFPQAMLVGRAFYVVVCYTFIWQLVRKERESSGVMS